MRQLQRLDLQGTGVTLKAALEFRKAFPECKGTDPDYWQ
jgi:hypothetical protein